jgi:hypothetical protein
MFTTTLVTALVLALPHGWHEWRADPQLRTTCDPALLAVAGSARPRLGPAGWRMPGRGQVLVFVEADHTNHPSGPLPRPRRFHVPWTHLQRLEGCCGLPAARGAIFSFRERGHLLDVVVVAGREVPAARRRATERLLEGLRLRV